MKRYRYVCDCTDSTYEDIRAMVDEGAQSITRRTFVQHTDDDDRRELYRRLGYDRYFSIVTDWHVGYYKGMFRGVPAYWMQHSAVERIFTLDGMVGPSLAKD